MKGVLSVRTLSRLMIAVVAIGVLAGGAADRGLSAQLTAPAPAPNQPSAPSAPSAPIPRLPDIFFLPTPDDVIAAMLKVARVGRRDVVYDLGCGDGRILIAAAKRFGARGVGIDIDPVRIAEARASAARAGVTTLVRFDTQDLFDTDLHDATVVMLYLVTSVNLRLRPKLLAELKPGTRVVSHAFGMGDWAPEQTLDVGGRKVFYWTVPPR